jgi:hypothetical protein
MPAEHGQKYGTFTYLHLLDPGDLPLIQVDVLEVSYSAFSGQPGQSFTTHPGFTDVCGPTWPRKCAHFLDQPWLPQRLSRWFLLICLTVYKWGSTTIYFFFAISRLASLNRQYVLRFFNLSGKLQTRTSQGFIKAPLKIRLYIMLYVHPVPIGSMVLLYMVTWIPSIYPSHVSIYTENNGSVMGYWNHCNDWLLRFYFIETYYTWGMLVLLLSITVFLRKQPLSRMGWLHSSGNRGNGKRGPVGGLSGKKHRKLWEVRYKWYKCRC